MLKSFPFILAGCLVTLLPARAHAQTPPDYDFNFITIDHAGNAPYTGPQLNLPFPQVTGRGQVNYDYRIARTEISTAQWAEFVNTFSVQPNLPATMFGRQTFALNLGLIWGARPDPTYTGPGRRWAYQSLTGDNSNHPIFGISWRDAAMYCNWLHNGKTANLNDLLSGAYDTSTWNDWTPSTDGYTDALTHQPGAKYWIPTLDEWMKAVYYDPHRYGAGQEGWWNYQNSSDQPPIPGLPGTGATTSATLVMGPGMSYPNEIPLGAYPNALSPWGLLDTASGANELTEGSRFSSVHGRLMERYAGGLGAGDTGLGYGWIQAMYTSDPTQRFRSSVRIVSSIPSPACLACLLCASAVMSGSRPRRRDHEGNHQVPERAVDRRRTAGMA